MIKHLKEFDDDFKSEKIKIINSNFDKRNVVKPRISKDNTYKELDNLIIGIKRVNGWEEKLEMAEEYIQTYNRLPYKNDKDTEVGSLGKWIDNQKKNYKNNSYIMKSQYVRSKWEEFTQSYPKLFYLPSSEEKWQEKLKIVEEYIQTHNKFPTNSDEDTEISSLGAWLHTQKKNYKNNSYIMKNEFIRLNWEEFIRKYPKLFSLLSLEGKWEEKLEMVEKYIQTYNKLPYKRDDDTEVGSLGKWIDCQKGNYKNNLYMMKNEDIRIKWDEFTRRYSGLFYLPLSEEKWEEKLKMVEEYIQTYNKLPYKRDKDTEVGSLGKWIDHQKSNYKNTSRIMKNNHIQLKWQEFTQRYSKLFT